MSEAGGLGILGGGYGEEQWLTRELDVLANCRVRFGVGFITWSLAKQPKLLDLVLDRKPAAVMLSFGRSAPVHRTHQTRRMPLQSVRFEHLLLRRKRSRPAPMSSWPRAAKAVVMARRGAWSHLLPEVVDAVRDRALVVAAGGIADGRGLAAALMLGASGVMAGTRFYATAEAAGADAAKERIRTANGDSTLRSIVFDITRRNIWPAPFTGKYACAIGIWMPGMGARSNCSAIWMRYPQRTPRHEVKRTSTSPR